MRPFYFYLFLALCVGLSTSLPLFAREARPWPNHRALIKHVFSPFQHSRFVDTTIEGFKNLKKKDLPIEMNHYLLWSPLKSWEFARRCDLPARPSGFLHTTRYVNRDERYRAQIAVPVRVDLKTSFLGAQKQRLLNSSLLTVSVLALDGDDGDIIEPGLNANDTDYDVGSYDLVPIQKFEWTIRQLCELDKSCKPLLSQDKQPIHLSLDQVVFSETFPMEVGNRPYGINPKTNHLDMLNRGKVRVRVDWSFQGICNEDFFEFKVGDQVQIIEPIL